MPKTTETKILATYFLLQALAVAGWWSLLILVPNSIALFQPKSWPADSLLGFGIADFVFLVGGSGAAAISAWNNHSRATTLVWFVAIVAWYPALYCLGVSILTDEAWFSTALMFSMAGLSLAMATVQGTGERPPAGIRVTPMIRPKALGWTLFQISIFWITFLWILPMGLLEIEQVAGGSLFVHAHQTTSAAVLFALASIFGLSSGVIMATHGAGTPLPTATAPQLVIAGPYRVVRNPMALAGITQGIAVGWYFGSIVVIVYAICGGAVWHFFVRPVEEADLEERFGDDYRQYKNSVGLWIPFSRSLRRNKEA